MVLRKRNKTKEDEVGVGCVATRKTARNRMHSGHCASPKVAVKIYILTYTQEVLLSHCAFVTKLSGEQKTSLQDGNTCLLYLFPWKAYGSVRKGVLCYILTEYGVPLNLVRLIAICLNEMLYIEVRIFSCIKWTKPRRCYNATVFNFNLEYAFRQVQENQAGLKLNGTHNLLTYLYSDDVTLFRDYIDTIMKTQTI
jgi:hypothetical protein